MSETALLFLEKGTIFLLVISLAVFSWSALRSRSLRKFQFQMSIFVLIWIVGEIIRFLQEEKIFTIFGVGDLGAVLHTVAMIFFSIMLWIRFYYSRRSGKLMIEMK
ncbi:MAG TPA: hypothetical protein VD710_04790 [Nitrososphaeraceae archaeon]|nr:hypothetical protein [Nitrososphaeraceae archaeon]